MEGGREGGKEGGREFTYTSEKDLSYLAVLHVSRDDPGLQHAEKVHLKLVERLNVGEDNLHFLLVKQLCIESTLLQETL